MYFIDFTNNRIEELKILALEYPKESIDSIDRQLLGELNKKFYATAYYLLSLSYNTLNNKEKELNSLNRALEAASDLEEKIRILVRRGGYFITESQLLSAFCDLSHAENIFEENELNNAELGISIYLTIYYMLKDQKFDFGIDKLHAKIDALIGRCTDSFVIAHYYKIRGMYYYQIKEYQKSIDAFLHAKKMFFTLEKTNETFLLLQHLILSKIAIKNITFETDKLLFEKYLSDQNNLMLRARYIIALLNANINPIDFYLLPLSDYLETLDFLVSLKDYKIASKLNYFIAARFEAENNFDLAIFYFKKQSEYNLKALQDEEENKLIELYFHKELQNKFNADFKEIKNSNPQIIKDYVISNMSSFLANDLSEGKYNIMSNLIVEQFKTQVSICTNYGIKFLETNNIQVLESDGNYTILYDKDAKRHISSKPLAYYEKQLDPKSFLRTHRSYIININYIVHFFPGRVGKIELTNGQIIEVSARKMAEVRKRILN